MVSVDDHEWPSRAFADQNRWLKMTTVIKRRSQPTNSGSMVKAIITVVGSHDLRQLVGTECLPEIARSDQIQLFDIARFNFCFIPADSGWQRSPDIRVRPWRVVGRSLPSREDSAAPSHFPDDLHRVRRRWALLGSPSQVRNPQGLTCPSRNLTYVI